LPILNKNNTASYKNTSGTAAIIAAIALLFGVPLLSDIPLRSKQDFIDKFLSNIRKKMYFIAKCATGNKLNFRNLIQVARASSGASPCVKNPFIPCVFLKLSSSCIVVYFDADPIFAICNALTKSRGYIIAAAQKDAARTGPTDFIVLLISNNFSLFGFSAGLCLTIACWTCIDLQEIKKAAEQKSNRNILWIILTIDK